MVPLIMQKLEELQIYSLNKCPFESFEKWFEEALKEENPSAFSLATATNNACPL